MIGLRVRIKFDGQQLKKKVKNATFRSLGQAGGAIRLTARRSIKRKKGPSRPGTAPHTQTGNIKRTIRYDVGKQKQDVAVGPVRVTASKLWELHEHGGTKTSGKRQLVHSTFRVGDFGPIRKGRIVRRTTKSGRTQTYRYADKYQRIKLKTQAQAARATRLIAEENARRASDNLVRHYPKRPFMRPALVAMTPRLPKFWKDSIR
ncbi:hypothetical protein [Novipirellula artificiosorum]|uniref:Phage virion morphogenesis family protein n=1 Tax=Novipirellula artificiosorum TaxID=2528016 RepID=A0A5C6DPW5_9BACT|nr:hypothetical protein [Novipirellula artificiosorum]TWU39323.1 hypothetical protein Poly41_21470 [Novipirellula artificiosorum]